MGTNDVARGFANNVHLLAVTLSPASVSSSSGNEQTFTIVGLKLGDFVYVNKPSNQVGLIIANSRVSAANTLAIDFVNTTAATITPTASEIYTIFVAHTLYQPPTAAI